MSSLRRTSKTILSAPPPRQPILGLVKRQLSSLFHSLGHYLATHQITSLLLCSLVICCLLFPALSIYFEPNGPTSAIVRRGRGEMIWELEGIKRQGIIWSEDEVCWDRTGRYYAERGRRLKPRVVRMEQVLISPSAGSSGYGSGALSKRTLHHTLQLQNELERRLLEGEVEGMTCVRTQEGRCAISSPSNWWKSEADLLADQDVHKTLSLPASSLRSEELPYTTTSTLVGVGRDRKGQVKGAHYLTMSFYLEDLYDEVALMGPRELEKRDVAKEIWRETVRNVVGGKGWEQGEEVEQLGRMREGMGAGRRIILKHLPHLPLHSNPRLFEDFLFVVGYIVVIFYVLYTMRTLNHVHSKIGLMLTGLIELGLNALISLSICWMLRLKVGLVPWKLIPFLVLVCGVDNMFLFTNAVSMTDISLPVPQRVALGLSTIGLTTTLTLAIELTIATLLLKVILVEVIRELIVFAAVALVVDYGLEMTFFTTILSIDIQRLELADLLQQGSNVPQPTPSESGDFSPLTILIPPTTLTKILNSVQGILRARAARSATFAFLVFINLLLYSMYGPNHFLPAFCSESALAKDRPLLGPSLAYEFASSLKEGRRSGERGPGNDIAAGAGAAFWNLINPANASSVHVYIEPVTVVKFYDDAMAAPESSTSDIVETSLWWKVGVVVVPISTVMVVLYFFLLFLLKDAELLDRQRSQAEAEKRKPKGGLTSAGVEMATLMGRHVADVELLSSSRDMLASWAGLEDQVVVWSRRGGQTFEPTALEIPITAEPPSLTLLALDSDSKFCAATTIMGRVLVWSLDRRILIDFSTSQLTFGSALHLFPSPSRKFGGTPAPPVGSPPSSTATCPSGFFTVHQDGHFVFWDCTACRAVVLLSPPPSDVLKLQQFVVHPVVASTPGMPSWPIYARTSSSGQLQLYRADSQTNWEEWKEILDIPVTTPSDPVTALAYGDFGFGAVLPQRRQSFVVVGTLSGLVSLYDSEGNRHMTVAEMPGAVRQIRLIEGSQSKCGSCSERITDGFNIVSSSRQSVLVARVYTSPDNSTCTCSSNFVSAELRRSSSFSSRSTPASAKRRSRRPSHVPAGGEDSPTPNSPSPRDVAHLREVSGGTEWSPQADDDEVSSPVPSRSNSPSPAPGSRRAHNSSTSSGNLLKTPVFVNSFLPSTSVSPPPSNESLNGDVPLFGISAEAATETNASATMEFRLQSIITVVSDERGGWDVLGKTVVGVRRRQATKEEKSLRAVGEGRGATAWEVWTVKLGASSNLLPLASQTASVGAAEGATMLDTLLASASTSPLSTSISAEPKTATATLGSTSSESLRRRHNLANNATNSSPAPHSLSKPSPLSNRIRFHEISLPFSRARPLLSGLDDTTLLVGLGNAIALITEKKGSLMSLSQIREGTKRQSGSF